VAMAHGVNANQVFKGATRFGRGEMLEPGAASTALLPVTVSAPCEDSRVAAGTGFIHRSTGGNSVCDSNWKAHLH
jgi:hypothetical protein